MKTNNQPKVKSLEYYILELGMTSRWAFKKKIKELLVKEGTRATSLVLFKDRVMYKDQKGFASQSLYTDLFGKELV